MQICENKKSLLRIYRPQRGLCVCAVFFAFVTGLLKVENAYNMLVILVQEPKVNPGTVRNLYSKFNTLFRNVYNNQSNEVGEYYESK